MLRFVWLRRLCALVLRTWPLDGCRYCYGAKGGVRGNENLFGPVGASVATCDYCSSLHHKAGLRRGFSL